MSWRRTSLCAVLFVLGATVNASAIIVQTKVEPDANPFATDGISEDTFDAPATVGNVICTSFAVPVSNRTITTVTFDGAPNLSLVTGSNAEIVGTMETWAYCAKVTSTGSTVTITISSALALGGKIVMWEVSETSASPIGTASANPVAVAGMSHPTGNVTCATACFLLGFTFGTTGVYVADLSYTQMTGSNNSIGLAAYRGPVAGGTYGMTTTSVGSEQTVNSLIPIIQAATGPCGTLTLLGVGGSCG